MASIALLGTGGVALFSGNIRLSAWSVSRTTFFFWIIFKLLLLIRAGWAIDKRPDLNLLAPFGAFFLAVTLSLLPDFRQSGDYRYFFFGCAHGLMLVDVFSQAPQRRWLPMMLGLTPVILVLRGLVHDPSILHFTLAHRFAFPLDHANTAGYLFAMSIPLGVIAAMQMLGWRRNFGLLSCATQVFGLILTFSRGAWLGWAASMLYLIAALKQWKLLLISTLTIATCVMALPSVRERLATMTRPRDDPAIQDRLQLISSSVQVGIENPLLGVGYGRGRLKEALRPRLKKTILEDSPIWHTHNLYVELFAGTGLLGLGAFLWLVGATLMRLALTTARRNGQEKMFGFALAAAWISAIIAGVGDIPFYHHEPRIFFFTLLGTTHIYCSKTVST